METYKSSAVSGMLFLLLCLIASDDFTENNRILLLRQASKMIGVAMRKKCDIAIFICSIINSKGGKLHYDKRNLTPTGIRVRSFNAWELTPRTHV